MAGRYFRTPMLIDDGGCMRPAADWGNGLEPVALGKFGRGMGVNAAKDAMLVWLMPDDQRRKPRGWVELTEQQYATEFEANEERPPEAHER